MKEIKVEETISHVEYIANDGTQFKDKVECKKYEESALGVLMLKYKDYIVNQSTEEAIWRHGTEDYCVDIVCIKDSLIIDILLRLLCLFNPQYSNPENQDHLTKVQDRLNKALKSKDYIFVGRGYSKDEFWIMESASEAIESIKNACAPQGEKE